MTGKHTTGRPPIADDDSKLQRAPRVVRAFFHRTRRRPWGDQNLVFLTLLRLVGYDAGAQLTAMQQWALEAFAYYASSQGHAGRIPCGTYGAWHRSLEDRSVWPSDNQIRNAFGGWNAAMSAYLGEPKPDVGARQLLATGSKCTRAGLTETLLAWKRDLPADAAGDALTFAAFRPWVERESREQRHGLRELPTYFEAYRRVFGSWPEALNEVGLWAARLRGPRRGAPHFQTSDMSDALILDTLRRGAAALGDQLTEDAFADWVHAEIVRAAEEGVVLRLPSASTATARFGTWVRALKAAGVYNPVRKRAQRIERAKIYTDADLLAALDHCVAALKLESRPPSEAAFKQWRARQRKRRPQRRIPCHMKLRDRFGGWPDVKAAWITHHAQAAEAPDR